MVGEDSSIHYYRPTLRLYADLIELWGKLERQWQTDKAKIEGFVSFIPKEFRINRLIFKKEDKEGIKQAMLQALKEGCWIGLRSCYFYQPLGKAPWIMGMKSRKGVQRFFSKCQKGERQIWLGTPAHYDEWLADRGLKEIIIMFNPPRLCPQYKKEHFVGRIECLQNKIRVEMRLHTDQTRDIEGAAQRKDLIQITAPSDYETYLSQNIPITVSFGRKYFKKNLPFNKRKKMKITIEMFNGKFGPFKIRNHKYARMVQSNSLKIIYQIANIIFKDWFYPPFNLYYRLQALREFGLGTLEFQGRMENGKVDWMLVYGLRGLREVAKLV